MQRCCNGCPQPTALLEGSHSVGTHGRELPRAPPGQHCCSFPIAAKSHLPTPARAQHPSRSPARTWLVGLHQLPQPSLLHAPCSPPLQRVSQHFPQHFWDSPQQQHLGFGQCWGLPRHGEAGWLQPPSISWIRLPGTTQQHMPSQLPFPSHPTFAGCPSLLLQASCFNQLIGAN